MSEPLKQALEQVIARQTAQYFALLKTCESADEEDDLVKKKLRHAAYDSARVVMRLKDYGVSRQIDIRKNNG
jgi:hypothetical protein